MVWGSGVLILLQVFYPFTKISIPAAYFYLTLNRTEKNIEIAMSDKSTGSLPAFSLGVATPGYFKGNRTHLHKRQLSFSNVATRYLGFCLFLPPVSYFLAFTLKSETFMSFSFY